MIDGHGCTQLSLGQLSSRHGAVAGPEWVYYSALILFLGAEFTQVYANRYGAHIRPDEASIPLEEKVAREQAHPSQEPAADREEVAQGSGNRD
jgi:hypothetical protein